MPRDAIGLDIGGANIKAATATGEAVSIPFELWRQPERLAAELVRIRERWPAIPDVAVTMTGELCDCFPTKRDGVRHILAAVEEAFSNCVNRVWSTAGRFMRITEANADHLAVASANWHALATWVGWSQPPGLILLIDIGSTTTDIIPILDRLPATLGITDADRLRSGELVYTGVRRTPVCAVLGPEVAAEWFATSHDVYVRLGMLPPEPENRSTADGRPMTDKFAHARLSRMLGGDPEITSPEATLGLARHVFDRQRETIATGIRKVLARQPARPCRLMTSGSGEFLAQATWAGLISNGGVSLTSLSSLAAEWGPELSQSACAYALAVLAAGAPKWD
jgi:(4-(4-[2-(gamma-L-glutamylamino)ethyl]phenoxymethyl)furan-2-yl)methanamine synthase